MRIAWLEINAWFITLRTPTIMHKHTLVNVHGLEPGFEKLKETDAAFNVTIQFMSHTLVNLFMQSNSTNETNTP